MKKQEILHVHRLLNEMLQHEYLEDITADLDAYQALETAPTAIHHAKGKHKRAVFALTESVTSELRDERDETARAAAD